MALTYRLHFLVKQELTDAVDWYEKERKGRGGKFFMAYLKVIKRLLANPLSFSADFDDVRKAHITDFPYTIYYEVFGNEVLIYAIFHQKRYQDAWKDRIN